MAWKMELKEAKEKACQLMVDKLKDWYDIVSFGEPVIESFESSNNGDVPVYILQGYVEVEFKSGWRTSAREHSRSGQVLFTVKLNAKDGKVLSLKHKEKM